MSKTPYKANSSTKHHAATYPVAVPVTLVTMGTQRYGAGGRSVASARKKLIEEIEKKTKVTEDLVDSIKNEILSEANKYLNSIAGGFDSGAFGYGTENKITASSSSDGHTLTWMKFGTGSLDEAIKKYHAARKADPNYKNMKKNFKKSSGDTDEKAKLRNMFGNMKRYVDGPVPYAARREGAFKNLHSFQGLIHRQDSRGSGVEHRGDSIFRMLRVEFNPDRVTHMLILDDPNAAKVMKWIEKGTSSSAGKPIMLGRGNLKRRFGVEVRTKFKEFAMLKIRENFGLPSGGS